VLIAAAVCPHPPLLIPEVSGPGAAAAGGSAGAAAAAAAGGQSGLAALRAACDAAVAELVAARADLIAVVGGATRVTQYPGSAAGSLRTFGVPYLVGTGEPVLPLSLTIGRWLLDRALDRADHQPADGPLARRRDGAPSVVLRAVPERSPAAECLSLGAQIARLAPRVAMLAMGDGPARAAVGVPGAADPEAERYHAAVAAALAGADPDALARLDPGLDAELMIAGRAAWQVLAGAAAGRRLHGRQRFAAPPPSVSYLVASWAVPH
jgi:hypothetical protein